MPEPVDSSAKACNGASLAIARARAKDPSSQEGTSNRTPPPDPRIAVPNDRRQSISNSTPGSSFFTRFFSSFV